MLFRSAFFPAWPGKQSRVISPNSIGGFTHFTPLSGLQEIPVATRQESGVLGFPSRRGLTPRALAQTHRGRPQTTSTRLYAGGCLGRKPPRAPQFEETPETPPSSRAEGLLFLHGLESCEKPSGVPRGPATSTGSLASQRHPGTFPKVPGRRRGC